MEKSGENSGFLWKMFIGEYRHNLDEKRRVSLPAKFRRALGKKVVITKGFEKCLVVYPHKEWEGVVEKLQKLPTTRQKARSLARVILAGAVEVEIDKLGRVVIPEYLTQYAQLQKEVIILGLGNRLEIWNEQQWQEYRKSTEDQVEEIAEDLQEFEI